MLNDLVTLQEVKTYLSIGTNTNSDVEILNLIPKVSALVKTYVGRSLVDFSTNPKVEIFSRTVGSLDLVEAPIIGVVSVELSQDYGKTFAPLEEYVHYVKNDACSCIDMLSTVHAVVSRPQSIRVTYTGGYTEVPPELKLATLDLVTYYLKSDMAVKSSRSAGANNAQIEYIMNSTLPAHIRRILDMYRLDI